MQHESKLNNTIRSFNSYTRGIQELKNATMVFVLVNSPNTSCYTRGIQELKNATRHECLDLLLRIESYTRGIQELKNATFVAVFCWGLVFYVTHEEYKS